MTLLSQPNTLDYNTNFLSGIYFLSSADYLKSRTFFLSAINETDPVEQHYSIYQSYLGLVEILSKKHDGLYYCHRSFELSHAVEFEVLINLACAEFISGNRRRAMQALDTLSSAKLSNRNTKMLNRFFEIIGRRECYDDGSLKRNKFFNRSLGKIFRKSSHINTRLIESFIKTMIDGLYKDSIQKLKNTPPL